MPRLLSRRRLAEGIYQDREGISAIVEIEGLRLERRFPLGTDLAEIDAWRTNRPELLSWLSQPEVR